MSAGFPVPLQKGTTRSTRSGAHLSNLGDPAAHIEPMAVNAVKPSYIRVESDEATYGLHIVLRFELEQQLIDGELAVAELPEAWNSRFEEYLGLKVTDDAQGALQDVHWSAGLIGYFPTYTLGTLYSAQFLEAIERELGPIDPIVRAGETDRLLAWLRKHVHSRGALVAPEEIARDATGEELGHAAFMRYLRAKYGDAFYRMWKFYLLISAAYFRTREHNLYQIVATPAGAPQPPTVRAS